MTFPELGIKRHVMAYMVATVIMLFGIIGYKNIGIDEYPDVDFPAITITTVQPGADAELIDNNITSVLLKKINGISGIDVINGTSYPGVSRLSVVFDLDKDINVAFNEVQSKVNLALSELPSDAETPQLLKSNNSDAPMYKVTLYGNRTLQQLNLYAEKTIQKKLETITGVSEIQIEGKRSRVLRVELDMFKLSSFGISIADIINAFNTSHVQMPGGYIISNSNEILLNLDFEAHSIQDLKNIVVKRSNSSVIRLSSVANVIDGLEDFRTFSSYNSYPSVTLGVGKIVGYNAFAIEKDIKDRLDTIINPNLEPGLQLDTTYNVVDYIKKVVSSLEEHLFLGTFLTAIIVFLFLRSFVSTLIVSLAIPISLLGAVFVMYIFGYTFNTITLLALLLLIGVVVDDAIIVLENIYRKMEDGEEPIKASIEGAGQVVFAVLAATLSLVSIFGPVMFMDGIIGRFFKSFAVVVTFGVIISYFVSLYITPMLCSRFLRFNHDSHNGFLYKKLEAFFLAIESIYYKALFWSLSHRLFVLIGALVVFFSSFLFFSKIPVEFIADGDKSQFKVFVKTPSGSNIYNTIDKVAQVEKILQQNTEVKNLITEVGSKNAPVNRATITVNLVDPHDRKLSQKEVITKVQQTVTSIAGATVIASAGSAVGGSNYKMEFNLVGPNFYELYKNALRLKELYEQVPRMGNVDISADFLPQLKFKINREQLALLNITSRDVLQAIGVGVGGMDVVKYNGVGEDERYDVRLKGLDSQIKSVDDVKNIYIKTPSSGLVRLDSVATPIEYLGFSSIERSGQLYSISIRSNPEMALGESLGIAQKIAKENLPNGYSIQLKGSAKELLKTINAITFVFGLAIMLLYMVLASQFNSFIQPLVLMASVPLAVVGGMAGLLLSGYSLNMFSMIGLILLVGLVAKNAILLIDFTNELRAKGVPLRDALLQACPLRLRPILMTSLTVIISMLPALLSHEAGSENNASLSAMVVGGMISSTFLTLIVIPSLYSVVEGMFEYFKSKKKNDNNDDDHSNNNQKDVDIING